MANRKQPTPASREKEVLEATSELLERFEREAQVDFQRNKFERGAAKHFVRRECVRVIQRYIRQRVRDGVNRPLKYLTIPGQNASDIGLFWKRGVLQQNSEGQLNVAICDKSYADEVALNLGSLGGLLEYSSEDLGVELRTAGGKLRSHFPFDVINMDIFRCLVPVQGSGELPTLEWMLTFQSGQSFLLLLTTSPEQQPTSTRKLLNVIDNNLQHETKFRTEYINRYGSDQLQPSLADITNFNQLIIPKFVAAVARKHGYKIQEHFAARYERPKDDRPNEVYEMVCHSFEFERVDVRKAALKYRPRASRIKIERIDDITVYPLEKSARKKLDEAYSRFVGTLPVRSVTNVTALLNNDPKKERSLDQEAQALDGWWKEY
jgi:hypothetical protein